LARACEYYDYQVFDFTGSSVSGHTVKHLLAALAIISVNIGVLTSGRKHVGG
jgi:hypothetical protein